jgi:glucose 1-dehydrogenase
MDIRLDGKAALVTGAGQGIGQGIAEALARAGADVAINYRTNAAGAAETARRVAEAGRQAIVVQADVGEETEVEAMFHHLDEAAA